MSNDLLVADKTKVWRGESSGLAELLYSKALFKSLSLLLARQARIVVPSSLLLLAPRRDVVERFAETHGYPLMVRVDYKNLPKQKPLGGIPLKTLGVIERVCDDLFTRGCFPLLHPHFDRFEDVYSCGVLLSRGSSEAQVEVVGRGFDAGDLRRGTAIPHESLKADLTTLKTQQLWTIQDDVYRRERQDRFRVVRQLREYIQFVSESGRMVASLDQFERPIQTIIDEESNIPARYEEMPKTLLLKLLKIARRLQADVLDGLPPSKEYVASLSYLPAQGWMLWDVYGGWYLR